MACGHPQSAVCVLVVLQLSTVIKLCIKYTYCLSQSQLYWVCEVYFSLWGFVELLTAKLPAWC